MRRTVVLLAVVLSLVSCGAAPTAVPTLASFTPTSAATAAATAALVATPTASGQGGGVKKTIATAQPTGAAAASTEPDADASVALPTATATATALPTASPAPQPTASSAPPTPAPAATDTPVPSSPYAVSPYFDEAAATVWDVPVPYGYTADTGYNTLGLPVDAGTWTQLARQWFGPYHDSICTGQDSLMVWQADTRQVSFLTLGSGGSSTDCYPDPWYRYQDTYQQGESNNEGEQAPAGQYVPVLGFGKVWREIRAQPYTEVGFATTEEKHTEGMVQRFENGTAYYFTDTASIYVLLDRYRRIGRSTEEFTSLTWFIIQ